MDTAADNQRLMKTLDDAWNSQDWDTFNSRHAENVAVYWPGQPMPTTGRHNHKAESIEFFKAFRTITLTTTLTKSSSARETGRARLPGSREP